MIARGINAPCLSDSFIRADILSDEFDLSCGSEGAQFGSNDASAQC
jgi:hypothetical protein